MAMKRRAGANGPAGSGEAAGICRWAIEYSNLFEFLTATVFEDSTPRRPGTMTLFCSPDGGVRMCLSDKDTLETAFISSSDISGLFERAEAGLVSGNLEWRQPRPKGKR